MNEITPSHALGGMLQTRDIHLASALCADSSVQLLPSDQEPVQGYKENGQEFFVFRFRDCPRAREIYKAWNQKDYVDKNPDDPISYMIAFVHNKNRLLDYIKRLPRRTIVKKGSKIFFVSDQEEQPVK